MTEQTFEIPDWNLERLYHEVAKLNKRGEKLGCPPVTVEVCETLQRVAPGYEEQATLFGSTYVPHVTVHQVILHGEGPKLAGWTFVGSLDHATLPGVVIVNTVPGEVVPSEFHNHDAVCNHCGKIRRRNNTFVLKHEDGHHTQVGRQCLRDFLGHDPAAIARHLMAVMRFVSELGDEDTWGGGGKANYSYDHFQVLRTTAAIIRTYGWVARSAASDGPATADEVLNAFNPPMDSMAYKKWKQWIEKLDLDNEEFAKTAILSREWLKTQPTNNEYMHNLHMIDQAEAVPTKLFGYWCSLVATYQRAQGRLRLKEAERRNLKNEWTGEVGQRLETEVSVVSIQDTEGYYGVVHIHRMVDNDGRTLIWFSNARRTMEEGHRYNIHGTVKKHDEFQDWKQTVLSRVSVLKEIESCPSQPNQP